MNSKGRPGSNEIAGGKNFQCMFRPLSSCQTLPASLVNLGNENKSQAQHKYVCQDQKVIRWAPTSYIPVKQWPQRKYRCQFTCRAEWFFAWISQSSLRPSWTGWLSTRKGRTTCQRCTSVTYGSWCHSVCPKVQPGCLSFKGTCSHSASPCSRCWDWSPSNNSWTRPSAHFAACKRGRDSRKLHNKRPENTRGLGMRSTRRKGHWLNRSHTAQQNASVPFHTTFHDLHCNTQRSMQGPCKTQQCKMQQLKTMRFTNRQCETQRFEA